VDGCFHLAAIASVQKSAEDFLGTHRVNLGGTVQLLDALRARPVPFVYASSAAVYGDSAVSPVTEDSPKRPQSAYGADKLASELHAAVAAKNFFIPTTGLRFFNVYGQRQPPDSPYSGVVSIFADRLARRIPVSVFGDGGQTRDLVHVSDVVRALRRAMERRLPDAPVFNVCTGTAISVLALAGMVGGLLGVAPDVRFGPPRLGEIRHSVGDPARGRAALGLGDALPLRDGLRDLLGV
jgi:UDP-glucose 4-epimerase